MGGGGMIGMCEVVAQNKICLRSGIINKQKSIYKCILGYIVINISLTFLFSPQQARSIDQYRAKLTNTLNAAANKQNPVSF